MKRIIKFLICRLLPFFSVKNLFIQKKPDFRGGNLFFIAAKESEPTNANSDDVLKSQLNNLQKHARTQAIETITNLYSGLIQPSGVHMRTFVCGNRSPVLQTIALKFSENFLSKMQEDSSIDEAIYWESITGP